MKTLFNRHFLLFTFFLFSLYCMANKKLLDHTVYDSWKELKNISVSDDGKYAVSIVAEQEGDNCLFIQNLENKKDFYLPRCSEYTLSSKKAYLFGKIKAPFSVTREEKIKKTKAEKMTKDTLVIINLKNFELTKIPMVKSFKTGKDYSDYIAYALDDTVKSKEKTNTLVVRHIEKLTEDTLKNVSDYKFSKDGNMFVYTTKPKEKDSVDIPTVSVIELKQYQKKIISSGQKEYLSPAFSEDGLRLTFLATNDSAKKEVKEYGLYYYHAEMDSARLLANNSHTNMTEKWGVSSNRAPSFSKSGKRLLFGLAPIPLEKDTTIPDFEKAQLDLWHWQEPETQPMQLVNLSKEQKRTFLSYIDLENPDKIIQLANETIPDVRISQKSDGRYALGISRLPYRLYNQWDIAAGKTYDMWVYDLHTGDRTQFKTGMCGDFSFSYNGDYVVWYDMYKQNYYSYNVQTGKELCLTCGLDVIFWNEKNDTPSQPDPYGFGMWYEDDKAVLVYDRYDIWKLDPSGINMPENITKEEGRKNDITFYHIKIDPEADYLSAKDELLLSAFDNTSKKNGYYLLNPKKNISRLIMDGYTFSSIRKAKDKNTYLFTKSNFNTSPDLYVTTNNWKSERKLTNINPQMKDYSWGSVELVKWTAYNGETAEGLLYKPENFDENKKYPVLNYFYERSSENLYSYYMPQPSWSIINIAFYVSRGYVVFLPDIHYTAGHPGQNAYDYVVSGVEDLCKNSWADKDRLAIQGQSWGGYQVAYLVTRTNMFKCAGAGAPVSNMFSAYNGIRWETGRSRQYQYEQTQSRIGQTMWQAPELYYENSPVFFADKVETPLLIMHNDKDGAVPWYQGIELFMGLRRLQKPVWMLQYNNEAHNLKERKNRKDLSVRLQQFFDYYLKDAPMPKWMKSGVAAADKGVDYGFEYVEE